MINIQIPKDIREFEPKFVGSLTLNQCIGLIGAAAIEFASVWIQKSVLHLPTSSYIPGLPLALIPLAFGWGKQILRMDPNEFLQEIVLRKVLYPSKRVYETPNYYDRFFSVKKQENPDKNKKKQKPAKSQEDVPPELVPYE